MLGYITTMRTARAIAQLLSCVFFCFVICIVIEILLLKFDVKIKPLLVIHDDGTLYAFVHGESELVKQPFASVVRIQSIPVRFLIL